MGLKTVLSLLFLIVATFAEDIEVDDPDVIVLTDANFNDQIKDNEFILVEFYAPWCGHCKRLAPEYAKAATTLKGRDSPAKLAKLDATQNGESAKKFGVSGYPTLKFFRNGEPIEYDGGRSEAELVSWVSKKVSPVSKLLATQEDIDAFVNTKNTRIVAFLDKTDEAAWIKVAGNGKFEGLVCGHVTDSSLFGDRNSGTIDIHKDGEVTSDSGAHQALLALIHRTRIQQRPKVFSEHWVNYLLDQAFPLVDKYSDIVLTRAEAKKKDVLVVFGDDMNADYAAKEVAEDNTETLVVARADTLEQAIAWGASGELKPTAVFVRTSKKPATFTVWNEDDEGELTEKSLEKFLAAARDGSYSSFIKSEPIPGDNDGPVTTLVGKTLPDALKSGKDVFVEFYAPWCGHCKNLAPTWEKLGEAFQNDENVVIAKVDATANKLPSNVNVRGYPTLIFFTAKGKQLTYNGERELEDLTKWVESKKTKVVKKEEKSEL